MKKPRKLTAEKRAAIARRRALHPPTEPTRVGSDLSLTADGRGGYRAAFIDAPEAKEDSLVTWFDYGAPLSIGR